MLNKLISVLITVGGLGYVNYSVAEALSAVDIHKTNKTQAIAYSALWSIADFAIFLAVNTMLGRYLSGDWLLVITMLLTVVIAFSLSVVLTLPLQKFVYGIYNKVLHLNGKPAIANGTVWHDFVGSSNKQLMAYLYSLDHTPLGFGYVDMASNDEVSNYSISLQPFNYNNAELQDSYDTMVKRIQDTEFRNNYTAKQFVDLKQGFIMITLEEK